MRFFLPNVARGNDGWKIAREFDSITFCPFVEISILGKEVSKQKNYDKISDMSLTFLFLSTL